MWTVVGASGESLGSSLATPADLDDDGSTEIAVGAPNAAGGVGAVHLLTATGSNLETISYRFGSGFGGHVAVPGDVNGDGLPNLVVGVDALAPSFGPDFGRGAFVVFPGRGPQ